MKIIFVISSLSCGGAEKVLSALSNEFVKTGSQIVIVRFDSGKNKPYFYLDLRIKQIALGLQNNSNGITDAVKWNLRRLKSLRQAISHEGPDVVVSFLNRTNVLTILACQGTGLPVIVSERNHPQYTSSNIFWCLLTKLAYKRCRYLVLQNKSFLSYYKYISINKIKIIPNPVSPSQPIGPPDLGQIIEPAIVAIGKYEKQKGFDLLIKAFEVVHEKRPDWKLYLFGKGSEFDHLAELVARLGLKKHVFLMGQTKNPAYYMSCAEIFILSSIYEGFPNVLVEAMAVGTAVISTNCSDAIPEIIENDETGLIVNRKSKNDLANAMLNLIDNKKRRDNFSEKAKSITEKFPLNKVVKQWNDLITSC